MAKAGRSDDQYMVRFPDGLRERIKKVASIEGRSMNSEIIKRLEESFGREEEGIRLVWLPAELWKLVENDANSLSMDPNLIVLSHIESAYHKSKSNTYIGNGDNASKGLYNMKEMGESELLNLIIEAASNIQAIRRREKQNPWQKN